jgi:hypothetical protein
MYDCALGHFERVVYLHVVIRISRLRLRRIFISWLRLGRHLGLGHLWLRTILWLLLKLQFGRR